LEEEITDACDGLAKDFCGQRNARDDLACLEVDAPDLRATI
jgi:hypothetical protein